MSLFHSFFSTTTRKRWQNTYSTGYLEFTLNTLEMQEGQIQIYFHVSSLFPSQLFHKAWFSLLGNYCRNYSVMSSWMITFQSHNKSKYLGFFSKMLWWVRQDPFNKYYTGPQRDYNQAVTSMVSKINFGNLRNCLMSTNFYF